MQHIRAADQGDEDSEQEHELMSRFAVAALLLTLGACGGKVDDGLTMMDVGTDTAVDSPTTDVPTTTCVLSDGTPVCGIASCPNPHPDSCESCPRVADRNFETAPLGVCAEDASKVFSSVDGVGVRCATCPSESDLCAYRGVDYACVRRPLCDALAAAGFKGCFFQDMTDYAPGPLPSPACPAVAGLCGGTCGACESSAVCLGRSQTHPFGVCAPLGAGKLPRGCARRPTSSAEACVGDDECVVFASADATVQKAADEVGFCVARGRCRTIRGKIPGGVFCTDGAGNELP